MKTTTVKFQRAGQPARYISSAGNYKGYLTSVRKIGVGEGREVGGMFNGEGDTWTEYDKYEERMFPYFDNFSMTEEEKKLIKAKNYNDIEQVIADGFAHTLILFARMNDKYIVEDTEQVQKKKEMEKQDKIMAGQEPIIFYTGIYGKRMETRLSADLWGKIKKYATYHKGDDEDMEFLDDQGIYNLRSSDVRGWTYKKEAIDVLIKEGLKVKYRGYEVVSSNECDKIDSNIEEENRKISIRIKEVNDAYNEFQNRLRNVEREYINSAEADLICSLEKIAIPGWDGPNIYGGGKWLHIKDNDLYIVYNNGHDGDDWSRNNYGTGGAGAICYKAVGQAGIVKEIKDWIENLGKDSIYINS